MRTCWKIFGIASLLLFGSFFLGFAQGTIRSGNPGEEAYQAEKLKKETGQQGFHDRRADSSKPHAIEGFSEAQEKAPQKKRTASLYPYSNESVSEPMETSTTSTASPGLIDPQNPNPLHGYFEALCDKRDYIFWNTGRFESSYSKSHSEKPRSGKGTYVVEGNLLKLQFEGNDQKEGGVEWEPRHFEQLVVQLGSTTIEGEVGYIMVRHQGRDQNVMKEVTIDVPAECGSPDWDCWRRTSEFLPFEQLGIRSEE